MHPVFVEGVSHFCHLLWTKHGNFENNNIVLEVNDHLELAHKLATKDYIVSDILFKDVRFERIDLLGG
jgi:hypothetical protein